MLIIINNDCLTYHLHKYFSKYNTTLFVVSKSSQNYDSRNSTLSRVIMNSIKKHKDIFCKRLKEARLAAGLSQKSLGIAAGIDEFVASTRINRYEKGVHEVDIGTAQKLADVLDVSLAYFYTQDDQLAHVIKYFHKLPKTLREEILLKIMQ